MSKSDVCQSCGITRSQLSETPWWHPNGFTCKPCQQKVDAAAKSEALAKFAEAELDDSDFEYQDECKCPHCATVIHIETEEYGDKDMECETCGGEFLLQVEYAVTFTTTVIGQRITA